MKNSIFLSLLLLTATAGFAQDCNLTEDRTDAYGNMLRGAEWSFTDPSGSTVNLMLDRTKDRYTFVFNLDQPMNNAVRFTLDGEVHPIIFNMSNGGTVNAWTSENRALESTDNGSSITFSEQYLIQNTQLRDFDNARVTAIIFKCSGRSIATGNAVNEIRFALNATEGEALSNAFRCLQKEAEPVVLKAAPKPRASTQTASSGGGAQEGLLRQLIQVVGEGTSGIKESVEVSGTSQLEMNQMMMEKLQGLTAAIEKLNETKKEKEFVPRVFGFGVYFKTNYMYSDLIVPVNSDFDLVSARFLAGTSINMTFNVGMRKKVGFRFEPNVDFMMNSASGGSGGSAGKASTTMLEAGLKLLLVIRRGRVNIYPGISGSFLSLTAKQTSGSSTTTIQRDGGSGGLILGGEYLLTPNIGIRLESGVLYYGLAKTKNGGNNTEDAFGSFARLGGSFYF